VIRIMRSWLEPPRFQYQPQLLLLLLLLLLLVVKLPVFRLWLLTTTQQLQLPHRFSATTATADEHAA